jgi:hypothetical protein
VANGKPESFTIRGKFDLKGSAFVQPVFKLGITAMYSEGCLLYLDLSANNLFVMFSAVTTFTTSEYMRAKFLAIRDSTR